MWANPISIVFCCLSVFSLLNFLQIVDSQDVLACGGFVKSDISVDFSRVEVKLYTKQGSLKYQTDCAPNNGYYLIPVYDKGEYVLKLEPPVGWQFEPVTVSLTVDGRSDMCSQAKDINFHFKGFSIFGNVVSRGLLEGPPDIEILLSLASDLKTPIQKTITQATGGFHFTNIGPGDYVVTAVHPAWQFDTRSAKVQVLKDNGQLPENLVVSGYEVVGRVFGDDGEGVRGVQFILFGKKDPNLLPRQCDSGLPPGFVTKTVPVPSPFVPLCFVSSSPEGFFRFPILAPGQYTVIPFYKSQNIKFDVVPVKVDVTVGHTSVVLQQDFKVEGFSVSGRVIASIGGRGIGAASVYVQEKLLAMTKDDGVYQLENMHVGNYEVQVVADKIQFNVTPVKINPNTPNLPDIVASAFEVCGVLVGDSLIKSVQYRISFKRKSQKEDVKDINSSIGGYFCIWLAPGTYEATVEDIEDPAVVFKPSSLIVVVKDSPIADLAFHQFKAKVEGQVHCLENCDENLKIILKPSSTALQRSKQQIVGVSNKKFSFNDVLPGTYEIMTSDELWCWEEKSFQVTVKNENLNNIVFRHKGFLLTILSTHSTSLQYKIEVIKETKSSDIKSGVGKQKVETETVSKNNGNFDVVKGTNKLCLELPGVYVMNPVGCHIFTSEQYVFDTSNPSIISIEAARHLLSGVVISSVNVSDVKIAIKAVEETATAQNSNNNNGEEAVLGPISAKYRAKEGDYEYVFTYWAAPHKTLEIKPLSEELLFYPDNKRISTLNDCMQNAVDFIGQKGLFLEGRIDPPLAGVKITVVANDGSIKPIVLETPSNGRFRVGPLHGHTKYDVQAEKQDYVLSPGKILGHFSAYKLAEISVSVLEDGVINRPLSGVILSLSGGVDYRKNNFTQEDGKMFFSGLGPGQYYLRAMMKEYQFDPPSRMVEVKEGGAVSLILKGKRVAFSCFGSVTTLTGDSETGVVVEAIGMNTCNESQEEVSTEGDGRFRLRGLKPHCDYEVRLKQSPDTNRHIERSTPKSHIVHVVDGDISKVHFIAFRPLKTMDVSGNLVTSSDFLPSLKVHLTSENGTDHTYALGHSSFFQFLSLPMDGRLYTLAIETTLSRGAYDYSLPSEVTFKGNCSYRHFTFVFSPKPTSGDHELTQGSYFALPVAFLIFIIVTNYSRLLPLANRALELVLYISNPAAVPPRNHDEIAGGGASLMNAGNMGNLLQDIGPATKKKAKTRKVQ